jgi:hypothetical protein
VAAKSTLTALAAFLAAQWVAVAVDTASGEHSPSLVQQTASQTEDVEARENAAADESQQK